jgi:two-component system, NtrC family, sensor histidine kinase HydH
LVTKRFLHLNQTKGIMFLLFLFLLFTTGAIIITTWQNLRSVRTVADQSIQNLATALSLSAENALRAQKIRAYDEIRRIFSDRIVAYAFIANRDGRIIYHTNPSLIGSTVEDKEQVDAVFLSQKPAGRRTTLRTGVSVYQFNYMLRLGKGHDEVLGLVLNRSASDKVVAEAGQIWWTVAGILTGFWIIGFVLAGTLVRYTSLQEELEQRKRMALIGQMTAVLTHEIRNAIGGIKGFTQWVDEKTTIDDPRKTGLGMILKGTDRVEGLVDNLLLYSKEETFTFTEFDLTGLAREIVDARRTGWAGNIAITGEQMVPVTADREKLERAIVNGVRNSMEAMGNTGDLVISIANKRQSIALSIGDTGPGIPEADLTHIFTPFFTTKTDGTGLGLAYSRKVVEGMGGQIELRNRTDKPGAILTINLPKRRKTI